MAEQPVIYMVEGIIDEAAVQCLFQETGVQPGSSYGKKGFSFIQKEIKNYNEAAAHSPWFVLCDLDSVPCAPERVLRLLPYPSRLMCLRVAVREVEAWFMADRKKFAEFIDVDFKKIPPAPEVEPDPKQTVLSIARKSRENAIRKGMVRKDGRPGAAYSSMMIEFARDHWSPRRAKANAPSLAKAFARCENFAATGAWRPPVSPPQ